MTLRKIPKAITFSQKNPGSLARLFMLFIRGYQKSLSPLLGARCRFWPSCSEYASLCLQKYSLRIALQKTIIRLLKCNPIFPGGVDTP